LVKKDLLEFLKITALNIIKEKYKKYRNYILSIINLLRGLLNTNLNNCNALFTVIDKTIDAALFGGPNFRYPPFFDFTSYRKPGFSNTRTIIKIVNQLEEQGINASQPIFGKDNNLLIFLKSTVEGYSNEINDNGYIHTANDLTILPVVDGVVTIPPGAIVSYGGLA
jgi:hypothetical protein